jgi:HlyD family secretion protein
LRACPALCVLLTLVAPALVTGCRKSDPAGDAAGGEQTAKPVVQVSLSSVRRATVREAIPITGTLAPLPNEEAKVAPLAAGRITRMFVKTGDTVTKGQILATLESASLLGQVQQAEAAARADAASLQQARLNLRVQENGQKTLVAQARVNLRLQQVALDKLLAGSRPQEVAQAQAAVASAEAAVTSAGQSLARSQTLFGEGLLARKDLEAAQAQQKMADAQLSSAREALSLLKQGNRPQDVEAGRVAVEQAQEQLRSAVSQAVQNAAKAQDVRIAERQLQGAEAALRSIRSLLTALVIRAPLAGTVVGRTLNPGESVDVTGAIAVIVNLDKVRLLLNVPAAQVGEVRTGQTVDFTVDSQPDRIHRAVISVVNRAVDPNTNTVQAEAVADNSDRTLRDDGFARGNVITALHPDALVVPADAVVDKDGRPTVFVVGQDSVAHAKPIKVGLRDGLRVEVLSGLEPKERVVTIGAYEMEDGTKVNTDSADSARAAEGPTAR